MATERSREIEKELAQKTLNGVLLSVIYTEGAMSGADVRRAIEREHGIDISPGAVYPRLQSLDDKGFLERQETPTEGVYGIADPDMADRRFQEIAEAHLSLAEMYADVASIDRGGFDPDTLRERLYDHVTGLSDAGDD